MRQESIPSLPKYRLREELHEYQRDCVKHVATGKGNALFLEMGCGKTLITLELLNFRRWHRINKHALPAQRILVLAPKRVCEQVWGQEVAKWGYTFRVFNLNQTPAKRQALLEAGEPGIYLMTYEKLLWLQDTGLFPFEDVVLDELTKLKNSSSKRWRAFRRMVDRHTPWVLGLTGTPAPNGYADLWAQMYCLDRGETLGSRKTAFLSRFFRDVSPDPRKYHKWQIRDSRAKNEIDGLLKGSGVISLRARDVVPNQKDPVELPHIRIRLSGKAASIYQELSDELMATMPDGKIVLPEHEGVTVIKLRQVSNGFMLDEDREVHRLHTEKLDALEEYLEEMNGEPLMVVYTFQEDLKMLQERFPGTPALGGGSGNIDETVRAWNAGELPMIFVQPQAAGHGLNLQHGGHHILFYSTDWNLETYQQVIARLNRQGQTSPVMVRHMVAGEIEEKVITALSRKAGVQSSLMQRLKHTA